MFVQENYTHFMIDIALSFYNEIVELMSQHILLFSKQELINLYSNWNCASNLIETFSFDSCSKSKISPEQKVPLSAHTLGIDLPSWFGDYQKGKRRIMFVGIDPMRHEKEFVKRGIDHHHHVLIGTPYALHLDKFRKDKSTAYSEFITKLSTENFVYLTDIYKTFFYTENNGKLQRSYNYYRQNNYPSTILCKEIEIIQPDLIITFGGESFKQLMNADYPPVLSQNISRLKTKFKHGKHEIDLLPMMHLSGINRTQHLNNFLQANGYEDKKRDRLECARCFVELINKL